LPTASETSAKRSPDGENAEREARNEESRNGGWESDVFETGLPFGGLTFCFFEEAVDAIFELLYVESSSSRVVSDFAK
jgi:hypothetical protein